MSKHILWVAKRADPISAAVIRYFHSHFYSKLQNPRLGEKKRFMLQSLAQWSNCQFVEAEQDYRINFYSALSQDFQAQFADQLKDLVVTVPAQTRMGTKKEGLRQAFYRF